MGSKLESTTEPKVFVIPGEHLDAGNVKQLKLAVEPLLTPKARLVFDMSGITFVDSSGLGTILSCLRQVNAQGGDLKLCGMTKPVRALFELVRMHRIFEILETAEQAVGAFERTPK